MILVFAAALLVVLVGLSSVGAPGDGWGSSPTGGIATQTVRVDHSLTAPRRARFADDLLDVLALARALLLPLAALGALAVALTTSWRWRVEYALTIPPRLQPCEVPRALRAPPVVRTT